MGLSSPGNASSLLGVVTQIMILDIVFLPGLGHYGDRAGEPGRGHGRGDCYRGDGHDVFRGPDQPLCGHPPDHQDPCPQLSPAGGIRPGRVKDSALHIPKGYIYFAMAFSVFVEMLNLRVRKIRAA